MNTSATKPESLMGARARCCRDVVAGLGDFVCTQARELQYVAAVLGTTLFLGAQRRRWRRTVRTVFARQFFAFGVQSVRFILILAVLVGISVVVQLGVWTGKLGQS